MPVFREKEAALVSNIFSLYLDLGCVSKLAVRLARENIRSKAWTTKAGIRLGGNAFARGALYDLLQNRLYIGEIRHRDQWYAGEHQGIVPKDLWDNVQARMNGNRKKRHDHIRERSRRRRSRAQATARRRTVATSPASPSL